MATSLTKWPGQNDNLITGEDGSLADDPSLASMINALQQIIGNTGAFNFVETAGGSVIAVPASSPGLTIQFEAGSNAGGITIFDHLGNNIFGVGSTGGAKVAGDRIQASLDQVHWLGIDGTTTPPSLLMPSDTYGAGCRVWFAAGTPASRWVVGTTNVHDLWYNYSLGQWQTCTVSGAGTAPGTWVNGQGVNPIGSQVAYDPVTANFSNTSAAGGSFQQADTTSGTAPTITLPNDGNPYRVEFIATAWTCSVADVAAIGIGTSPTNVLAATNSASLPTTNQFVPPLVIPNLIGTGQVLKIYTEAGVTGHTVTVKAAAGPGLVTPASLAAYREG